MEFEVSGVPNEINFGASGIEEISQNVRTIMTTIAGSVPLDRSFGIDMEPIDGPLEIAKARLTPVIIDAIHAYEPRVKVVSVKFEETDQGELMPEVQLRLADGVTVS